MAELTPAAWLARLDAKLAEQRASVAIFEDYYAGAHRMAFATQKFRQAFGNLFRTLADNWCRIVVDASVERLAVQGFRFGEEQQADAEAWEIWQANYLDAESVKAHTEAVKTGAAYIMVAPPPADGDPPLITCEHPTQVVIEHQSGNHRLRSAALKRWSEGGYDYATVFLPDFIHKFRSKEPRDSLALETGRNWVRRPDDPGGPNPLGVVPVIPLYNNPGMLSGGQSDLVTAVPLQDAINKLVADMLIASEFAAFPQRVLMGVEVPTDDSGNVLAAFELKAAVTRFWALENPQASISEFSAADLKNYVAPIATLLQHLSAQTRTPPHYLLAELVNISGDALQAAEAGLVAKVKRKQIDFSDAWEEAIRLSFSLLGKADRARETSAETIWRDPENRSQAELADALLKLSTLGVPAEVLWERYGFSPQEIDRMTAMGQMEQLLAPAQPELPESAGQPAQPAANRPLP